MPTKAETHLLNREPNTNNSLTTLISSVLQEAINYATTAYQKCVLSKEGKTDEAFPPLATYLHIIQLADSIEVLITHGCGSPNHLLLRSMFEARLSLEYLLEKNREERSKAWIVKNKIDQMNSCELMTPTTKKGAELEQAFAKDETFRYTGRLPIPDISKETEKLEEDLNQPSYKPFYDEYKKMVSMGNIHPEWYSFFNGPRNIKALAKHLNQGSLYLTLYASWSRISHMNDAHHLTARTLDGNSFLGPIRNQRDIAHISTMALSILVLSTQLAINNYCPYYLKSFSKWYAKEIHENNARLVELELLELEQLGRNLSLKSQ
ncbi:hypothetical protein DEALK_01490 [Dehalogenimonas alkenigignens]|uniref:Uncharacterized protein n=1 Tax=Dehalogenimonas alkenigignens TaxID=1217799 RepID=A0A0W0GL14_9CHLR|nr:DUF5677 domain-containing protein [Dehalogenimonas alkenigignens]KTB49237.1 hypothetical protein DEALK_01490 [Dehalogenimonas alkenigignens]